MSKRGYHITRYPPFDGISVSSILLNKCVFVLSKDDSTFWCGWVEYVCCKVGTAYDLFLLLSFVRRYLIVKENRITDRFWNNCHKPLCCFCPPICYEKISASKYSIFFRNMTIVIGLFFYVNYSWYNYFLIDKLE